MRIVVIGSTGRIGNKVLENLAGRGHEAFSAAPFICVDNAAVPENRHACR
jgi:putative NADH-flavin reductase